MEDLNVNTYIQTITEDYAILASTFGSWHMPYETQHLKTLSGATTISVPHGNRSAVPLQYFHIYGEGCTLRLKSCFCGDFSRILKCCHDETQLSPKVEKQEEYYNVSVVPPEAPADFCLGWISSHKPHHLGGFLECKPPECFFFFLIES